MYKLIRNATKLCNYRTDLQYISYKSFTKYELSDVEDDQNVVKNVFV
jgi:hypothetical protein